MAHKEDQLCKKSKNGVLCTQRTNECNLSGWNYLRKGTCHQENDRILYDIGPDVSVGHHVRGYYSYPGTFQVQGWEYAVTSRINVKEAVAI